MSAVKIASTRRGEVLVASDSDLGAVIDKDEGAVMCILGNEEESPKHG